MIRKGVFLAFLLLSSSFVGLYKVKFVTVNPAIIRVPYDYPSIQSAIDAASPGDTIMVYANGTTGYREGQINVTKRLALIADASEGEVVVDGLQKPHVFNVIAYNVTMKGFTIKNSNSAGILLKNVKYCCIENNNLVKNGYGVWLSNCNNTDVTSNLIDSNEVYGILMNNSNNNLIDSNNVSNNTVGISLWHRSEMNNFKRNAMSRNRERGLDVHDGNNLIDTSNIVNGKPVYYYYRKHYLVIDGLETTHLTLYGCWNCKIRNCNISNGDGISLLYSDNNTIVSNTVLNNTSRYGHCGWFGAIDLFYSKNNMVQNNYISNNKNGISLNYYSDNNTVIGNTVFNNNVCGIILSLSENNLISKNTATFNMLGIDLGGVYGEACNNMIVSNNVSDNSGIWSYYKKVGGIKLSHHSRNNVIIENTILNNGGAGVFMVDDSNSNIIANNNISNDGMYEGIIIYRISNYNVLDSNNIFNCCVYIGRSNNNIISNNCISNSTYSGITLWCSNRTSIFGNNVSKNTIGIYVDDHSNDNTLNANNLWNNSLYGIFLNSGGNSMYHNNFFYNLGSPQARDNAANEWDHNGEGNYWSDYTGEDKDGDGISETPYVIDTDSQDRYPLMKPWIPIPVPDFTISASPVSEKINPGKSVNYIVTVTSIKHFSSPITLRGSIEPSTSDITLTFNPETVTPPSDGTVLSKLIVSTTSKVKPDTYTITIKGIEEGRKMHSTSVTLIISEIPKWTFMVYINADNNLEKDGIKNLNEMEKVGSTKDVNILVQIDRIDHEHLVRFEPWWWTSVYGWLYDDTSNGDWSSARRYFVTKDSDFDKINSLMIKDLGELNMGDPKTLTDFVVWAKTNYPAWRYCLVIIDHGGGWWGISEDWTNKHSDLLDMTELKEALANAGLTIDVLAFDACLMSMIDVAYQIKDYVNVIVGSSEYIWPYLGDFPFDSILNDLSTNPDIDPKQLGKMMVQHYKEGYQIKPLWKSTLSAIDTSKVDELAKAINNLAQSLRGKLDNYKIQIQDIRSQIEEYGRDDDFNFVDIYHFAQLVKEKISETEVLDKADLVMNAVKNTVIDEWHQSLHPNSHGISIYFPDFKSEYVIKYSELDLSTIYEWDDFLKHYLDRLYSIAYVWSEIPEGFLDGITVYVDNNWYVTFFIKDLSKEVHNFEIISTIWINWTSWRIYVFSHWEDPKGTIISTSPKFTYDMKEDKWFIAVFKAFSSGTTITLRETQRHLYLHVYDLQGRHVGLNYETNKTEIEILGANYFDNLNGTIIITLQSNITNFRITVDAKYAKQQSETYNLTASKIDNMQLVDQANIQSSIQTGNVQEYTVTVSPEVKVNVIAYSPPWWLQFWYVIVGALAIITGIFFLVYAKNYKKVRYTTRYS